MPTNSVSFSTGPAIIPDVGSCNYNGCDFSPLFVSSVSGGVVKDAANRTTKYMEYTIGLDGYVTLPNGATDISPTMDNLRQLLTAQAGHLIYSGRGFNLDINPPGRRAAKGQAFDVAWGPIPEMIEFQPLGGGRSAKVQWRCKTRIPEIVGKEYLNGLPLLQHTFDTSVSYGEDGYSSIAARGVIEIPNTRLTKQSDRRLLRTADDFREVIDKTVMQGVDLDRFRYTRRNFSTSKDKRTLEWDIALEEKPYMDLPPGCTLANGTYSVRPKTSGMGLINWLCTLRATYNVRADEPRRLAWFAFLALLRLRMSYAQQGDIPILRGGEPGPFHKIAAGLAAPFSLQYAERVLYQDTLRRQNQITNDTKRAWLIDFSIDEGLYLDSKQVSFSATWRLVTSQALIMKASGLWRKVPEYDASGRTNFWAATMKRPTGYAPNGVMSSQSWLRNRVDPALDFIVDFGSG